MELISKYLAAKIAGKYSREARDELKALEPDVIIPCSIGDTMWCIREVKGVRTAQQGIVSEMFFRKDMKLMIVVKYVGRGIFHDTIFASRLGCEARIDYLNGLDKERENNPWTV